MTPSGPAPTEVVDDSDASIERAVAVLRGGGLVAIPTETVYGLAADASDPAAVRRIFEAKGRPADHPVIVHLPGAEALERWARPVPDDAHLLAAAFWPGPLTVVLERHPSVPTEVTGGRDTVALRVPDHPVAARLLSAFGGGLAAPSANRFGRVSPTTAADVVADLGAVIDLVVDGGPCTVGVESTIVELVGGAATVLRPGGVSAEELAEVLGRPVGHTPSGPARAPGMLASHYAPATPLAVLDGEAALARVAAEAARGRRVGVVSPNGLEAPGAVAAWDAGGDVATYARWLYRWLRAADGEHLDLLVVVPPEGEGLGVAVADRLRRAAHG
ncbi:MAG TPA: L-threonylcarbamoyladenylate synthase [Acidimicrobiales bacterium]|nr:L-threonylcarbamoyladenylate synthase [Acidimicrobiales bacterium]